MGAAIGIRQDFEAATLRRLATTVKDAGQARRLLALAAVYDGADREAAARIGGMDRQTLRDWVHRFNQCGPDGLINVKSPGRRPKLSTEQMEELKRLVEAGPDAEKDGFARWRCVDLKRVLSARFAVDLSAVSLGRILKKLGFSHISARPRHPKQDPEAIANFKKKVPHRVVGWVIFPILIDRLLLLLRLCCGHVGNASSSALSTCPQRLGACDIAMWRDRRRRLPAVGRDGERRAAAL